MRILRYLAVVDLFSLPLFAQGTGGNPSLNVRKFVTDPSPCLSSWIWYNTASNTYKICPSGTATAIGTGGGGAVTSVFARTGAVVATSGDYTVAQVTGAAPLASPTFTGTVTLPASQSLTTPNIGAATGT